MAWNRPSETKVEKKKTSKKSGLVAGVLIVVLGVAGYFYLTAWFKGSAPVSTSSSQTKIKDVKPAKSTTKNDTAAVSAPKAKPKTVEEAVNNLGEIKVEEVKKAEKPVDLTPYRKRIFDNGAEQLMGLIFTTEPGCLPFPIPHMDEQIRKDFASALISKLEAKEDDDEYTLEVKERVELAKKEMRRYLKEGGDPDDFMQYYYNELRTAFDHREEALRQANQLAEEDPSLAREFVAKVNEKFKEKGIKELDPKQYPDEDEEGNPIPFPEEEKTNE